MIKRYKQYVPEIGQDTFVAETAVVIGDVVMGSECSIWYSAVVRGDVNKIRLGDRVRCVVRIRTVKRQGDGFSYALTSQAQQHIYDNHDFDPSWSVLDLNYRTGGWDIIGKLVYYNQHSYQISDKMSGNTFVKMAYMGLVGWLLSGVFGKECENGCNM